MPKDQSIIYLIYFILGFFRAAILTYIILIAGAWGFYWAIILSVGCIGGYFTLKDFEKSI